ncbi:hypothetical protein EYB53_009715 [Candidatus Chloroploca sp. M-50]|uniref:Uncharacterized protein n=1 Tax=Candidatus Chloroploca mongolica TaxID=2528176 RepID=A0ABS4D953_9CHLR|nr:hypothetical protein [Candidatus Chloroploca mongolica]MBP1465979.1 hypothetical protein [Candidatus Chloroploca mongolica]
MSDGRSGDETEAHAIVDDGPPANGAVDPAADAQVAVQSGVPSSAAEPNEAVQVVVPSSEAGHDAVSSPRQGSAATPTPEAADAALSPEAPASPSEVVEGTVVDQVPGAHQGSPAGTAARAAVAGDDTLETIRLEPSQTVIDADDASQDVRHWHLPLLILLGFLALLILALLNSTLGLWHLPGSPGAIPTRELILSSTPLGDTGRSGWLPGNLDPGGNIPPLGVPGDPALVPGATFAQTYERAGGLRILGLPITGPVWVNGREIQWFERARLEHWPEHTGTPFEVQLGLLGVEFTQGRAFARQQFFVSRPDLRYFPETGYGVGGRFLRFWEENGDRMAFGLPISEEFDEVMPDGLAYRVQYFERVRMEYHPQYAGSPYEVQLGLLGSALLSNAARPTTLQPVPTPVPLP